MVEVALLNHIALNLALVIVHEMPFELLGRKIHRTIVVEVGIISLRELVVEAPLLEPRTGLLRLRKRLLDLPHHE